ncbi:MAG: DMT family transporter, partial [Eubacteriales bacterium]|nr:DMT family transporter [Eubacteriales bacterium]
MKDNKFHIFLLLICAFFWGTTFVAQSIGAGYVDAYTYLMGRSWIAVVVLTPVVHVMDRISDSRGRDNRRPKNAEERKFLVIIGIICGTFLCLASAAQQAGMAYTTASKASFLTALYVIMVPVFSIFLKKKPPVQIWICVFISLIGMLLLCLGKCFMNGEAVYIEKGDSLVLLCAVLFSFQVLCVDHYVPMVDGVRLSRMQFLVVAVESTIFMFIFEHPGMADIMHAFPAILYAGIFSSGVAYTLQIIGQEDVNPTVA